MRHWPSGTVGWKGAAMNVSDLIGSRTEVYSIPESSTVHDAARYLREHQVRSVGVLDAAGRLAGVVSQSDISDKVAAENKCPAWMRVTEIMSSIGLVTVTSAESLDVCLRLMEQNGIYHLLVVDDDGAYRGMLSVSDLLRVSASNEKARADLLESFIFERGTT
jgi:CBS domain-containing protein